MRFDLISDLHLPNYSKGDLRGLKPSSPVLALLGDVCEVCNIYRIGEFFEFVSKNWDHVLYIPGNHEFYGSVLKRALHDLNEYLTSYKNVVIMDNEVVTIDGCRYIGSTLWSDMEKGNPLTMLACKDLINDYRYISRMQGRTPVKITPEDTIGFFDANVHYINKILEISDAPYNVVLTHHAPSYQSVSPRFKGNASNGAFVSNLDEFILDRPISVWAHGHTHSTKDYMIGDCRIVCNPLGYARELYKNDSAYQPLKIEVIK